MAPLRRIKLTELNKHLVCGICNGYLVEATTITECIHTFCRTCIVDFLKKQSSPTYCPSCDALVHKTKPILGLREDRTLQDVVFKLVPDLFRNEMARRADFYKRYPKAGGDRTEQSLKERRHFFHVDDQISLSLEYLPPAHAHAHALGLRPLRAPSLCYSQPPISTGKGGSGGAKGGDASEEETSTGSGAGRSSSSAEAVADDQECKNTENDDPEVEKKRIPLRRYLKCPAAVQVRHLEKFIRLKYNLDSHHKVDIVHNGDCLSPELTLLDVVYMYKWTEDDPLKLQYTVIAPPLPLRKRPRPSSAKSNNKSNLEPSPKKAKLEHKELIKSASTSPFLVKEKAKLSLEEVNTTPKTSPTKVKRDKEGSRELTSPGKSSEGCKGSTSPGKSSPVEKQEQMIVDSQGEISLSVSSTSNNSDSAEKDKACEDKNDATPNEGCSSLNSSRDEADDAMVIDESSVNTSESQAVPMEVDSNQSHNTTEEQPEKIQKLDTNIQKTSLQEVLTTTTTTTTSAKVSSPVHKEMRTQVMNGSLPQGYSSPTHVSQGSVPPVSKCGPLGAATNSSIESLKALVNNSGYPGFPSKQGHPPKSNNSNMAVVNSTSVKPSSGCVSAGTASPKAITSLAQTSSSKTVDNCIQSPGAPDTTGVTNRPSTPNTHRPGTPINHRPGTPKLHRPGTPNTPVRPATSMRPNTPATPVRSPTPTAAVVNPKLTTPKLTSTYSVASPQRNTSVVSSLASTTVLSVPTPQMHSPKVPSTRLTPTSTVMSSVSSKGSLRVPVSSSSFQTHSVTASPISNPLASTVSMPTPSLPASTSLTPALKTPLSASAPMRMPPSTQGPPGAVNSFTPVARNPIMPPAQRLVSNSYRASLQMNGGGIRMNGMMGSAPRPLMDPTKPRLGRPPNSVRVAAGRMVPQPILPRGATPREIYPQKSGGKGEGAGRGRPKGQSGSGTSARGGMNRPIAPHPSSMSGGGGVPINRPSGRVAQTSQNSQGHPAGGNKEAEAPNGFRGTGTGPQINGTTSSHSTNKGLTQSAQKHPSSGSKSGQGSGVVVNGNIQQKDHKKTAPDNLGGSPSLKPASGGSPKTTAASTPTSVPTSSSTTNGARTQGSTTVKSGTKSPGRSKSMGVNGNTSSILSIAQSLANKQLHHLSKNGGVDGSGALPLGCSTTAPSTMSPANVAASLPSQLTQSLGSLGLASVNPALMSAYMSEYAAVQNLLSLSSLNAAARMKLAMTQVTPSTPPHPEHQEKEDNSPMDLSPTNKGAPATPLAVPTRPAKGSSKGPSSNRKSPIASTPTSSESFKPPPVLSPKGSSPPSSTPPSVPSPKPAQSPSPDSATTPQGTPTISPPTPEVTITKLPSLAPENPLNPNPPLPSSTKTPHTNTVSITKRPSAVTPATVTTGAGLQSKYGVTRSPSNASVRQIPNPSHLSHSQSSTNAKGNKPSKQGNHPSNNNNNNNNNNSTNKAVKVDS